MNNYSLTGSKPSIDMGDVKSVKELIFNKAREKSASLASEKEENMTFSVQNDVMQDARTSISGGRIKPFGVLTKNTPVPDTPQVVNPTFDDTRQLKHNVQSVDNNVYTASMRDEAMNAARNHYRNKPTLMESLKFLNTQAAIKMVNNTHSKIV